MKFLLLVLTVFSFNSFADGILGTWKYASANGKNVYNLDVVKYSDETYVKYVFIYMGGKINESASHKFKISKLNNSTTCYNSHIYDDFFQEYADVKMCLNNKNLEFFKISNVDNTPYIPKKVMK